MHIKNNQKLRQPRNNSTALVGIFEVAQAESDPTNPKWKFRNTLTGIVHWTYGTWDEIVHVAMVQSQAWQERFSRSKGAIMRKMAMSGVARANALQAQQRREAAR